MCLRQNVIVSAFVVITFVIFCYSYDDKLKRHFLCPECNRNKTRCKGISSRDLEEILGPAFNARYMSISEPSVNSMSEEKNGKRNPSDFEFYVDSQYKTDLDEKPAWNVLNHVDVQLRETRASRYKRDSSYTQEWKCQSRIQWIDLGPDYFPRYLRSVECIAHNCWFNIYKCKPRSFTVKILRKKKDKCAMVESRNKIGSSGLPRELRELWVWEERAVNFCCDCSFM